MGNGCPGSLLHHSLLDTFTIVYLRLWPTVVSPIDIWRIVAAYSFLFSNPTLNQGLLSEGEGSLRLTSCSDTLSC